jgi:hypothetical protein
MKEGRELSNCLTSPANSVGPLCIDNLQYQMRFGCCALTFQIIGQFLLPTGLLNFIRVEIVNSLQTLRHDKVQSVRALIPAAMAMFQSPTSPSAIPQSHASPKPGSKRAASPSSRRPPQHQQPPPHQQFQQPSQQPLPPQQQYQQQQPSQYPQYGVQPYPLQPMPHQRTDATGFHSAAAFPAPVPISMGTPSTVRGGSASAPRLRPRPQSATRHASTPASAAPMDGYQAPSSYPWPSNPGVPQPIQVNQGGPLSGSGGVTYPANRPPSASAMRPVSRGMFAAPQPTHVNVRQPPMGGMGMGPVDPWQDAAVVAPMPSTRATRARPSSARTSQARLNCLRERIIKWWLCGGGL